MKQEFSIRISRQQTVNGRWLASMNQTDALKQFKGKKHFNDEQIKKAHGEAKDKAKELDKELKSEAEAQSEEEKS